MSAIRLRLRAELRSAWRRALGLVLLVGLAGGAVIAVAAGARRTDSAYGRFVKAQLGYDVLVVNYPSDDTAIFDLEQVARLPQVADAARTYFEYLFFQVPALISPDNRIGTELHRFKILEGRPARPDRPQEMVVGFALAEKEGLQVGSRVQFLSPEELDQLLAAPTEEVSSEDKEFVRALLQAVPGGEFTVVGIEASPGEFPPLLQANRALVHLTPAFSRVWEASAPLEQVLMVRLHRGQADVEAFLAELKRMSGGKPIQVQTQLDQSAAARRSIRFLATSLWLLAGLLALVVALVLAQLLARHAYLEADENPALRSVGMSPRQLFALGVARFSVIGAAGAAVAVGSAVAFSPLFPTGLARVAEPHPGLRADPLALALGGAAVLLAVPLLGALPAMRASRVRVRSAGGLADESGALRPSRVADAAARAGFPPPATVGVRMVLEPGRGRSAVPVRTTLASVALAVTTMTTALAFGASLEHLLDTPRLYGLSWDLGLSNFGEASLDGEAAAVAAALPEVAAVSIGSTQIPAEISGRGVGLIALDPVKGRVLPPITRGRAPRAPDEIALGRRTLGELEAELGDTVAVRLPGSRAGIRARVVGEAVLPTVSDSASLGEGGLLTFAAARQLSADLGADPLPADLFLRLRPGARPMAVKAALEQELSAELYDLPQPTPTDIVNFGRVQHTPLVLGGILAGLALATLAHAVASAVHRRRRELAILNALGFLPRQIRATVAWHATTVVALGLLVGLPLGIAAGRWSWTVFAHLLGIVPEPVVPIAWTMLAVPAAVLGANLVAAIPARVAARSRPALALRAD